MRRVVHALGPLLGLAFVLLVFQLLGTPGYLSFDNFRSVSTQTVIVGLGAIGMTFVIVSGGIDLSVGSVTALACVVTALAIDAGAPTTVGFLAGIGAGALCGLVNGVLVAGLRIVPFIATLGMLGAARGLAKKLANEQVVVVDPGWIGDAMARSPEPAWLLVSPGVWAMFALGALAAFALRYTPFGVHTVALGSNEDTARLCGVHVGRTKIALYTLCGLFAGLAGALLFGRLTLGDPTTAMGKELDVIAAVVIGGGSLSGGEGRISGSLIGALLMAYLANGCNLQGVPNSVQEILIGGIIVAAVALDRLRHRRAGA